MGVYPQSPDDRTARFMEWHAAIIRDPIARLRYLRRATGQAPPRRRVRLRLFARVAVLAFGVLVLPSRQSSDATISRPTPRPRLPVEETPAVWPVEKTEAFETYSNGLRIENRFAVSNRPRNWRPVPLAPASSVGDPRKDPVGIVFHTTESHMVSFDPERTHAISAAGMQLLEYVRSRRSYHFVIDRFGRVHRVVSEADAANHAGWSVWADDRWIYINLNESFLSIAFEARHGDPERAPLVSAAQIRAGRSLTEMLRSRYHIASLNCVAHAQVSVNPGNFRVGYHTDWAHSLPFAELGLPDNYARPVPSLVLFGFGYDPPLADSAVPGMAAGLRAAESIVESDAAFHEIPPARYREILRQRYRETTTALENLGAEKESNR